MNFVKENKRFSATYLIWAFLHLSLIIASDRHTSYSYRGFYPFNKNSDIDAYGFLELFIYLVLPILTFIIMKLVGEDIKRFFRKLKDFFS